MADLGPTVINGNLVVKGKISQESSFDTTADANAAVNGLRLELGGNGMLYLKNNAGTILSQVKLYEYNSTTGELVLY